MARRFYLLELLVERFNFWRRFLRAPFMRRRREVAARYLRGQGVEIGALHLPLPLPRGARVRYVDRMTQTQAQAHYPELHLNRLVPVDVTDNGESLAKFASRSLDFVIGNNLIEHCQNPLQTLENWLDKLRENGIIFMAVPYKRFSFDKERALTPLGAVLRDYHEGPQWSARGHYEEWARVIQQKRDADLSAAVESLLREQANIHFHVWDPETFLAMVLHCQQMLRWPLELEEFARNGAEFIVVLRKTHRHSA